MSSVISDKDLLFRAIGRIVVEFQKTERMFSEVLASHMGLKGEDRQAIITGSLSFGQKVDLYSALAGIDATAPEKECIDKVCVYLKTAEEYRNKIVHSDYFVIREKDLIQWYNKKNTIRGAKGLKMHQRVVDIPEMEDCASIMSEMSFTATSGLSIFRMGHDECPNIAEAARKIRGYLDKRQNLSQKPACATGRGRSG